MSKPQLGLPEFEKLASQGNLVPVWREVRGDTETPVSAFLKLPSPTHAFLLESVEGGERWGRYSFLGDRPMAILRQIGTTSILEEGRKRTFIEGEPLAAARALLGRYQVAKAPGLPRFV